MHDAPKPFTPLVHRWPRSNSLSCVLALLAAMVVSGCHTAIAQDNAGKSTTPLADMKRRPRNVIFILSDDHRHDFMSFMPGAPKFLETPNMDRMAKGGVQIANYFVSTSLCSPSRASILTGQYMHRHKVVDNQRPVAPGTVFFPQYLQKSGYQTAFVGKWHMGHDDDRHRPGFDHWASFKGQGVYFDPTLNINGKQKQFKGYNADVLTTLAIDWMKNDRQADKPFYLHLAFKAVHYPFQPAKRHLKRYQKHEVPYPPTMANTERNYQSQSKWIKERRYSIHGVDHWETGNYDNDPVPSFANFYRRYCEAVHSLDENIGRVLDFLEKSGLGKDTLVIYTSDNGFALGEHGFYDKRDAFEESIRVPMIAYAPGYLKAGGKVQGMVQNIDVAPTLMELAGAKLPGDLPDARRMDGRSFLPLLESAGGEASVKDWRKHILYEYHWEWNFPATPTLFAIRTDRYKYVYYHGVWDRNGFYDLQTDPHERHNLIEIPAYREKIDAMKKQLFEELGASGGLHIPVRPPRGERLDDRKNPR